MYSRFMVLNALILVTILSFGLIGILCTYTAYGEEPTSIWIASPRNLDQVPNTGFKIIGGSVDTIQADCEVMVKLNGAEPYLPTIPTGSGGTSDYSSWQFVFVTPSAGPNSVIAKYLCWDDPNLD